MDQALLNRLRLICDKIQAEIEVIPHLVDNDNLVQAQIIHGKLEATVKRFNNDLMEYFRMIAIPASEEIRLMSGKQLEAEDSLAELQVRINQCTSENKLKQKPSEVNSSCRLPKLQLPEYNGDILAWSEFWDSFQSNIGSRNLPEVDKLSYLKSVVNGDAKKAIDGLPTTAKNYEIAISILKKRFGKTSLLIDTHYANLYQIKTAYSTAEECRKTFDDIERNLKILESLGENINQNHLRFMLMEKFPADVVYELRMKINGDSIQEIRDTLEKVIAAKEDAERITGKKRTCERESSTVETLHVQSKRMRFNGSDNNNRAPRGPPIRRPPFQYNKYNFRRPPFESNNSKGERDTPAPMPRNERCAFCSETHLSEDCSVAKTVKERAGEEDTTLTITEKGPTILQTAVVHAWPVGDSAKKRKYRLLLDPGSQRSYITFQAAEELQLPIEEESHLTIFTFGTELPQQIHSPVVTIQLQSKTKEEIIIQANCVELISRGKLPKFKIENIPETCVLADDGSSEDPVHILIGNEYYFNIIYDRKIQLGSNLFLVESALGWIISGRAHLETSEESYVFTYAQMSTELRLQRADWPLCNEDLTGLWDLEVIGITDSPKTTRKDEAIKNFNDTTEKIDNRYTVSWPWITYPPGLPDNFGMAFGRLTSLLKRMDQETLMAYDNTFQDQLERGIIEVVPDIGPHSSNDVVHYLPFHGIRQRGKPMRIVYDASSKSNKDGKSLNECLYRGPLLLEDLTGLLVKFRTHKIGLSSDIEKAFLQIALHEKDRDVTRFLWLKDTSKPLERDNILYLRFRRVPFGVISSPFLLNATIKQHLSLAEDQRVREKASDIYVDNFVSGSNTTEEAIELYKSLKGTFQDISMTLRDWSSNSKDFLQNVPDACKAERVKVLGLEWDTEKDTLRVKGDLEVEAVTKRGVSKTIACIYDPCGYAVPYVLPAKLFLQRLWKAGVQWDSPLSRQLTEEWRAIRKYLEVVGEVSVDRCYMKNPSKGMYELHCFTDSSMQAFAAVVYLVCGSKRSFVIGKSRLVPIKEQESLKIPRLELLGVLIGSRLVKFVLKSLQLEIVRQVLWTDSQIVIEWCRTNKLLPPFVARRIEEIKTNSDLEIRYVPSELNPADIGTRHTGSRGDKELWLKGPQYIVQEPKTWPAELKVAPTCSLVAWEGLELQEMEDPMDIDDSNTTYLNPREIEVSEASKEDQKEGHASDDKIMELKKIQAEHFPSEVEGKKTCLSLNLGLFKDIDDLLRCKGRMKNTTWPFDKRYPILIPKNSEFTNDIIRKIHQENMHVGVSHTLDRIRETYWIPQGRSQVQSILRKCPECIKHQGGPYKLPETPALPKERVNFSSPFTYVGTDYMGPLLVNNGTGDCKRWISLYTCLAVRAIHLEVVKDLTAEEGLLALRRMVAARGVPSLITSDNATHFKLLSEILQNGYCIEKDIRWKFIPQLAPWHGGFYERLIGLVKMCMKKTLQKHLLNDGQLVTVVKEIQAVLNTRPLTRIDSEPEHVLKPSDFLTIGRCIVMEASDKGPNTANGTVTKDNLIHGWRKAQITLKEFKELFENRYLPDLRERYSHSPKEPRVTSSLEPEIGQIVQIKGDSKNRINWRVGKIVTLIKGKDGLCRTAKVRIGNAEYTRSIAHLYPLEIEDGEERCKRLSTVEENAKGLVQPPELPPSAAPSGRDDEKGKTSIDSAARIHVGTVGTRDSTVGGENSSQQEEPRGDILEEPVTCDLNEPRSILQPEHYADANHMPHTVDRLDTNMSGGITPPVHEPGSRQKRAAALRAVEKIREWTSNLVVMLQPVVGSVATGANTS